MTYQAGAALREPAPCLPSVWTGDCGSCSRLRRGLPEVREFRSRTVVIDGSVVTRDGVCPMALASPARPAALVEVVG